VLEWKRNGTGGQEEVAGRVGPDPELVERPRRRTFTAAYKLKVLREVDACTKPGQIGALLRREGLYTSHLSAWRKQRAMIEQTVEELTPLVGTYPACQALGVAPATIYRRRRPPEPRPPKPRPKPARALSVPEREAVLEQLHSERFLDCSPAQVWATLLRRGPLPGLGAHDVPHPGRAGREPGAARPARSPGLRQVGVAGCDRARNVTPVASMKRDPPGEALTTRRRGLRSFEVG